MTDTLEIGPIAEALPADKNGWQRLEVWAGNQMCGGDAEMEYTAYYGKDDLRLEVTYFVVAYPRGCDQPEDVEDWGVEEMAHSYRVDAEDELAEDGTEDYSYDGQGWPYTIDTFGKACERARSMALEDESWKLA